MRRECYIYDEIGYFGLRATDFRAQLTGLALAPDDELCVRLNSPGGEIYDGLAIYSLIRSAKCASRTVCVDGLAASMGSVIAMAGDEIVMGDGSLMMIHDPAGGCMGTSDDMRETADVLDKHRDALIQVYTRRTGKDAAEIQALMAAETWWTGAEAVAAGFASRCESSTSARTRHALDRRAMARFTHVPATARRYFDLGAKPPKEPIMNKDQIRRRALVAALLADVVLLAAEDTTDTDLQQVASKIDRTSLGVERQGSPLALLKAVETVAGKPTLDFGGAQAEVLTLGARLTGAQNSEEAEKSAVLDEAIRAGKGIHPTHKTAWMGLPLATVRERVAGLPVVSPLPQGGRKAAPLKESADNGADESYGRFRAGLGIKPPKAEGGAA